MADFWSDPELQQPDWLHRIWLVQLWGLQSSYAQLVPPNSIRRFDANVTIKPLDALQSVLLDWNIVGKALTRFYEQMMFVSGENADASTETTGLIEEIVRAQVIEMVSLLHYVAKDMSN